jgi:LCP family protein required for cell wall assembly
MDQSTQSEGEPTRYRWVAVALSVLMPGFGQLYLRRYRRAAIWLSPLVVAVVAGAIASRASLSSVVGVALSPRALWGLLIINVFAAVWRIAAAIDAYLVAGPATDREQHHRVAGFAGWVLVGVVVFIPHAGIGKVTVDALVLLDTVFVLEGEDVPAEAIIPIGTDADIVPDPAIADTVAPELYEKEPILYFELDPDDVRSRRNLVFREGIGDPEAVASWSRIVGERPNAGARVPFLPFEERVGADRITILLAGGDGGPGRGGMRTDTMMVATIDLATGGAAIFGFPRNLGHTPLPPQFENAFVELQQSVYDRSPAAVKAKTFANCKCFPEQLNALYPFTRKWTGTYPNEVDPGMAALRDTLEHVMGIPIDYYALADMAAFVDLVEAVDGIDVYVQQALKAEVSPPREGDAWATVDVDVGWNHLSGSEALAYARARKNSSDYVRMQRQRCMMRAVAAKAQPLTLLRSFSSIVDAVEGSVVTNFPLSLAPDLLAAAASLDFDDIDTIGFVHGYWEPERDGLGHPILDLGRVRSKVQRVIAGEDSGSSDEPIESECDA